MCFKHFIGLFFALGLVACSSLPEKSEAIADALTIDAGMRAAVGSCAALGETEKQAIVVARNQWWQDNSDYVLAADWGLLQLNWDDSHRAAESQRVVLGLALLENIHDEALIIQSELLKGNANTANCEKLVKNITKGKYDIDNDKSAVQILESLHDEQISLEEKSAIAQSINSRHRKYGRSLFVVEKVLRQTGCTSPNISLLRNSWPLEVYDATCDASDYLLVRCEWGRCEIKR